MQSHTFGCQQAILVLLRDGFGQEDATLHGHEQQQHYEKPNKVRAWLHIEILGRYIWGDPHEIR